MAERYEAVVVGGGPGGYVAGIRLGQHGKKTLVVEREHLGGVCLNWGCIPSKALIHAGNLRHEVDAFGSVFSTVPDMDATKLQEWKEGIIKKQRSGVGQLLKGARTEHLEGEAMLTGPHSLQVKTKDGTKEVEFDNLVLATGAKIIEIPGFPFSDDMIGYARDAVSYNPIPQKLVIIGGGIIGSELGSAYRKMGAEVTIVEMMDQILVGTDKDLVRPVMKSMKKLGINVMLEAKAKGFSKKNGKAIVEVETKDGETEKLEADRVLVAVGFKPNTAGLGLETAGVKANEKGWLDVDQSCRTNVPHIFAIGDMTGPPLLAHRASHMGEVAAEVISGKPAAFDVMAMPLGVFTDPEVAQAGLTEAEAEAKGYTVRTGMFPMTALGRASAMNATEGVVKVVVDDESDVVLGVGITAYNACDLIAEACLAIEMGALAEDLSLTVHVHPTLSEGVMEAAKVARGEPLHIPKKPERRKKAS
ncbi:MAG: dihydrolipoyl dehydrogenase [Myxococcota bacterium]